MKEETRDRAEQRIEGISDTISEYRTMFMLFAGALIFLGLLAIIFPLASTIAVKAFLGWIILIGGAVTVFHAFSTQKWSAFFFNMLVGVLYVFVGGWLAFVPLSGIVTLTFLLAFMFMAQGVLQSVMAFRLKPQDGWGWILVAGSVAILAGFMIFAGLPSTAEWALGLLTGITLISNGWAYLSLALRIGAARNAVHERLS